MLRSPRGCRSRSGPMRRRGPICRRGSLIQRARNRRRQSAAAALRAMAGIETRCGRLREPNDPAAWGYAARSPMTGEIWRIPRPHEQIRPLQGPVSACKLPATSSHTTLNLFHSTQTKPCLGHCITRGIGLRRQATILRLRGAVLFIGDRSGAGAGIRTRPRG